MEILARNTVKPPLSGWLGGKSLLAKRIISRIPEHLCYAEVFAGAAWVLFMKSQSKSEVLNDWSGEIANLYRVVKNHPVEFYRQFDGSLAGREEFTRLLATPADVLTDVQRAARYYFIHKCAFGGRMGGHPTFGYSSVRPPKFDPARIEAHILAAHHRLQHVYIEKLPYGEIIKRYDRRETFFYLDPPYWGCEDYYGKDLFNRDDFWELADALAGIQGRFLLSLNDVAEVREIFSAFQIEAVTTSYSCANGQNTKAGELFITNY